MADTSRLLRRLFALPALSAMLLAVTPASQAATPAEIESARTKFFGTWEATPTLDSNMLEAEPGKDPLFARANALGTRVVRVFRKDGTFVQTLIKRDGPEAGRNLDQLTKKRTEGKWSIADVTGRALKLRVTQGDQTLDYPVTIQTDDQFEMDVFELQFKGFQSPVPFRRNVAECAFRWLRANNTGGPDAPVVREMTEFMGKAIRAHEDFTLRFGKSLMKSGKPTMVCGFCEQFFVFDLSEAQGRQLGLADTQVSALHAGRAETFPVLSLAKVSDVKLDTPGPIDLGKPIHAKATCTPIDNVKISPEEGGDCSVRVRLEAGDKTIAFYKGVIAPVNQEVQTKVTVSAPEKFASYKGPVLIFIDLCRETKFQDGVSAMEVVSNSHPILVDAVPAK